MTHNWADYYRRLYAAGYTDSEIAMLAGRTRSVINAVRNRRYNHPHYPTLDGATRVLGAIAELESTDANTNSGAHHPD